MDKKLEELLKQAFSKTFESIEQSFGRLSNIEKNYEKKEKNYLDYMTKLEKENRALKSEVQYHKGLERKVSELSQQVEQLMSKVSLYESIIQKNETKQSQNKNEKTQEETKTPIQNQGNTELFDNLVDKYFRVKLDNLNGFSDYDIETEKKEIVILSKEAYDIYKDYSYINNNSANLKEEFKKYKSNISKKHALKDVERRLDRIDLLNESIVLENPGFNIKTFLKEKLPAEYNLEKLNNLVGKTAKESTQTTEHSLDDKVAKKSSVYVPKHSIKEDYSDIIDTAYKEKEPRKQEKRSNNSYYVSIKSYFGKLENDANSYHKLELASLILSGDYINENGKRAVKWKDRQTEIKKYYDGRNNYTESDKNDLKELEIIIKSNKYANRYRKEQVNNISSYLAPKKPSKVVSFFRKIGSCIKGNYKKGDYKNGE